MADDGRIALLERRTERLSARVEKLEATLERERALTARAPVPPRVGRPLSSPERPPGAPPPTRGSEPVRQAGTDPARAPRQAGTDPARAPRRAGSVPEACAPTDRPLRPASRRAVLEDLVAGRVLAWAGGAAMFIGLVLLFAIAVSRGWIGEGARTLMGGLGSLALAVAGAWLQERRAQTDAAMAAAAAGIAGLFATSIVAGRVYELVPAETGLLLALATGAAATALAVRWGSRGMATLGVLGGLAAPVLVGAPSGGLTAAILFVAALAAAAICVHQGWDWLGLAAFAVVTPQWLGGLSDHAHTDAAVLLTLAAFGALFAVAAAGHDVRGRSARAPGAASVLLLALNALVVAGAGWAVVDEQIGRATADAWLALVAGAHLAAGVALLHHRHASRAIALTTLALGTVAADLALAQALDGLALALVWAASAALVAAVARRTGDGSLEEAAAGAGLGLQVALALLHVLVVEAPLEAVVAGDGDATGFAGVAGLAAMCFAAGALLHGRPDWRDIAHALGIAALAYLPAVALEGPALVVAWAAEAAALAVIARAARAGAGPGEAAPGTALRDRMGAAWIAGVMLPGQLVLAAAGAVALTAPWRAVSENVTDVRAAVVALLAVAAAAFAGGEAGRAGAIGDGDRAWRVVLQGLGVAALTWLAVVTLDGSLLVAVLAAGAVALAEAGRRFADDAAVAGGGALLALGLGHALVFEAPPQALLDGSAALGAAAVALAACAAAAGWIARATPSEARAPAAALGATLVLHLASIALVTAAGAGERAQMLLSALWAAVGVATLIAGLVRDHPALRTGALVLIGVALAKVFLYDLATLTAMARVASFLALGMLLLAGAFAWQRIRPRPLPDLREAPPGARG